MKKKKNSDCNNAFFNKDLFPMFNFVNNKKE